MSFVFNADEIFAMAEEIEKNGARFYRDAKAKVKDRAAKDFLDDLAAMEDEHLKTFSTMRTSLTEQDRKSMTFDPANESALYLNALADTRVFFQKTMGLSSLEEIFKAAIQTEKDSIAFYLGMKELVPASVGRGRLEDIIKEEMRHIRLLSERLAAAKK
jgi:rubrerythrin